MRASWNGSVAPLAMAVAVACASLGSVARGQLYDAPASYYSTITNQTGATLKTALMTAMSTGHNQSSYDQAGDYLPFTDANPANLTQMFEFYTHNVIQKPSASHVRFTGLYQSREHVWPDSLQGPGDTTNSTRGSRGDIHMLKPLSQSVNSSRGNKPFGGATNTGSAGGIANGRWFPGSTDKGDAARIIFYGATRWSGTLSVVDSPSGATGSTQMGDLQPLLRFHYQDTPDLFERRRNDVIYRGDDTNTSGDDISGWAGTNNRNAYIDRPEYVWSVFVNQQNDTRLSVATPDANGASTATVNLGRVLRNAAVPAAQNVTLGKAGVNGTYYSVTASGAATSTVNGRYNAFAMDATGSQAIGVGLNTTTTAAGLKSGSVVIDNLDVTTQGGAGRGANDGNDTINVSLSVLDASNSSFGTTDSNTLAIDFGDIAQGQSAGTESFSIYNVVSSLGASLTAGLDLDSIVASGNTSTFSSGLGTFTNLGAGLSHEFLASMNTSLLGDFAATYTLNFSDENLPGTVSTTQLILSLSGSVVAVPEPGMIGLMFVGGVALLTRRRRR